MQNGFIERFNRTFREDVLDAYWFEDLEQLGILDEKCRYDHTFIIYTKLHNTKRFANIPVDIPRAWILERRKKIRILSNF